MNLYYKKRLIIVLNCMNKRIIAVTIGDIDGIGIELLIKLWKLKKITNFILITNYILFNKYLNKKKIKLPIKVIKQKEKIDFLSSKYFFIFNITAKNNIDNTYQSLIRGYYLTIEKYCSAIITLPLNKKKLSIYLNKTFKGQTELFQKLDNKKYSNMIFYSKKLIILSLTTHSPIKDITKLLNKKNYIYNKIKLLSKTLKIDFQIKNPRIVITGINPHAGENGEIGNEENLYIKPSLKKLKKKNILIDGPLSADSIFSKSNLIKYDCFICNYHDQALIPFKIISNFKGVKNTGSLDIIRISPVHGTAYDLVGKNKGNFESLLYSFKLINKFIKNRSKIE